MNKKLLGVVVCVALCSSCLTYSLHPWFDDEAGVFEEALLGRWGHEEAEWFEFKRGPDDTYLIAHHAEKDPLPPMIGRLGKIDGVHYLDVVWQKRGGEPGGPLETEPEWVYAAHQLCRLTLEKTRFRAECLDPDKMDAVVEAGELRGIALDEDPLSDFLIVSKTEKLQGFLAEHGRTADVWDDEEDTEERWLPRM